MKDYNFKINGNDYSVSIARLEKGEAEVLVNGTAYSVEIVDEKVKLAEKPTVAAPKVAAPVAAPAAAPARPAAAPAAGGRTIKSPLPGVIIDIKVNVGDKVNDGDTLMVLEAMKMENNIDSDMAGVVKAINIGRGDSVMEGDVLITLE